MSIKSRFLFTLVANLAKAVLGFLTGLIIARGLEPEQYGVFAFLLASFSALLQLLDMGSSSAFFTFASKRVRSSRFILSFIVWLLIQFVFSVTFILVLAPDEWIKNVWHGEERLRIVIAFCGVFMQRQAWNFITQLGESQRLTTSVQTFNIVIALAHLLLVIVFFVLDRLSVELVFGLIFIEFVFAAILARIILPVETSEEKETLAQMLNEYKGYCLPLIPYAWFGVAMSFADTWLLQQYGGAVQQAFYSVGAQFAMVSLLATMSVLKILWKEVAEAWSEQQLERVYVLFNKTSRVLFFVGACVSGFLIPWTPHIISITLGEKYIDGATAMAIMFLYPVHQSLGQVIGSMYYAMEKTKPYVVLGSIHIALSLVSVYFVLAGPNQAIPGMGLGAVGLSLKMVIIQFLTVNLSIYYLSRIMGWPFKFVYQIVEITVLLLLGYGCFYIATSLLGTSVHALLLISTGALLYGLAVTVFILWAPQKFGLENMDLVVKVRSMLKFS